MRDLLVDTDVLIDFLRGRERAGAFLVSMAEKHTLYCSAITVAEIYAGMRPEHPCGRSRDSSESRRLQRQHKKPDPGTGRLYHRGHCVLSQSYSRNRQRETLPHGRHRKTADAAGVEPVTVPSKSQNKRLFDDRVAQ